MRAFRFWVAVGLTFGLLGCEDDPVAVVVQDARVDAVQPPDTGPEQDMRAADVAVPDPDAQVPDAGAADEGVDEAVPDMQVVDMALPDMDPDASITPLPPGDACSDEQPCAEANTECFEGACRYTLKPNVYRMFNATVYEPANSRAELQAFLQLGVATESLNLMFEAAGFVEGGDGLTRWYVGNGYESNGNYLFNHNLPIQAWDGLWNQVVDEEIERNEWHLDGESDFILVVPGGRRMLEDGTTVACDVRLIARVRVTLWEDVDAEGSPIVSGLAEGSLLRADVERIVVEFGGQTIRLIDFLEDDDLVLDTDNDGIPDAYPFVLEMNASPKPFADPDSTREREPNACGDQEPCQVEGEVCSEGLCVHPACIAEP